MSRHPVPVLLILLAMANTAHTQSGGPSFHFSTVAVTGESVVGTTSLRFDRFGLPFGPGGPVRTVIDEEGRTAFHAYLGDGNPATPSQVTGLLNEVSSGLDLIAIVGDPATGTSGSFAGFPSIANPLQPSLHAGAMTFSATVTGGSPLGGLWTDRFGPLVKVLLTSDTLPGTPAGSTIVGFGHALRGTSIYVDAIYSAGGPVTLDNEGLWVSDGIRFQAIVVRGMPAPGTPAGVVFGEGSPSANSGTIDAWDANRSGLAIFDGYLAGPGVDEHNDEGIWIGSPTGLRLVAREGDPIPGQAQGVRFGSPILAHAVGGGFLVSPTVNDRGTILFGTTTSGPGFDAVTVFRQRGAKLDVVARAASLAGTAPGDPAAGFPTGFTYDQFNFGTVSNADETVLAGRATNGSIGSALSGIWRDRGHGLELVAGAGRPVAALSGTTFTDVQLAGFSDLGLLYYVGRLSGPAVTAANDQALFVQDADGRQAIVLRTGDAFDVGRSQQDLRVIASITAGTGVSAAGVEPIDLTFTDGSMAVVKATPDLALTADTRFVSVGAAGSIGFALDAGAARASRLYLLAGSASGFRPGFALGGVTVPLELDAFTALSLSGTANFVGFAGVLDPAGRANASFKTFAPLPASIAGATLHFAYVVGLPFDFASNAVPVTFTP